MSDADPLAELRLDVRPATLDDAPRLFDLVSAVDLNDFGDVDITVDDLRDDLSGLDLATDSWLVTRPGELDGPLVAFAAVERHGDEFRGQVSVHPDWRRRGIGTVLAQRLEESVRARVTPDGTAETLLLGFVKGDSPPELRWAKRLGFTWARRFLRMRIDLDEPPPDAEWPDGIMVRDFVPGRDEQAMHEAQEEAFSDHWGHVTRSHEDWARRMERSDFDPHLWHLALDGERVIGTASNSILADGVGWVSGLGVVPSHRRRGTARALLLHSFGVFWRRGLRAVALGVDAESLTGATRLYEHVGMRVVQQYDQVRKVVGYSASPE